MMLRLIALALLCTACSPDQAARQAVRKAGYTDIHIVTWQTSIECAGASDSHEFTAYDKDGFLVHGAVCCQGDYGCVLKLR